MLHIFKGFWKKETLPTVLLKCKSISLKPFSISSTTAFADRDEKLFFGSVDTFVVCKQLSTQFIQKQTKVVEEVEATSRQDWRSKLSFSFLQPLF